MVSCSFAYQYKSNHTFQFIKVVEDLYDGATTTFATANDETRQIKINQGVKQGDLLSLFNVCLGLRTFSFKVINKCDIPSVCPFVCLRARVCVCVRARAHWCVLQEIQYYNKILYCP